MAAAAATTVAVSAKRPADDNDRKLQQAPVNRWTDTVYTILTATHSDFSMDLVHIVREYLFYPNLTRACIVNQLAANKAYFDGLSDIVAKENTTRDQLGVAAFNDAWASWDAWDAFEKRTATGNNVLIVTARKKQVAVQRVDANLKDFLKLRTDGSLPPDDLFGEYHRDAEIFNGAYGNWFDLLEEYNNSVFPTSDAPNKRVRLEYSVTFVSIHRSLRLCVDGRRGRFRRHSRRTHRQTKSRTVRRSLRKGTCPPVDECRVRRDCGNPPRVLV